MQTDTNRRHLNYIYGSLILVAAFISQTVILNGLITSRYSFGADFYTFWLAGREMFIKSESPYSLEVTQQSQLGIYGRLAQSGEDEVGFVYPPYSLFILLPAVWMDFPWAMAYWFTFNIYLVILAVWLGFPQLPAWVALPLVFFYPLGRGLVMGQFAVPVGAIFILVYALLGSSNSVTPWRQAVAGSLLAWTTIKPQLSWLLILFFLAYAVRARHWYLWFGFGFSWIGLAAISWLYVPGWLWSWLEKLRAYSGYIPIDSLGHIYAGWIFPSNWLHVGEQILYFVIFLILTKAAWTWWRAQLPDGIMLAVCLLVIQLIHPHTAPSEQITFLLPMLIWTERQKPSVVIYFVWLAALLIPWLIFLAKFNGREPVEIATWTPLFYLIWFIGILIEHRRKSVVHSTSISSAQAN